MEGETLSGYCLPSRPKCGGGKQFRRSVVKLLSDPNADHHDSTKIAVQPVGQAGRLWNVKIKPAITIEVTNGNSLVAVDIHATGGIDPRTPVADPAAELPVENRIGPKSLSR